MDLETRRPNVILTLTPEEVDEIVNVLGDTTPLERQNFFKGWKCYVDDALFINPRGEISSASCGVGNNHGNILDSDLTFDLKPVICSKQHCHCGTDIIIPKESYELR